MRNFFIIFFAIAFVVVGSLFSRRYFFENKPKTVLLTQEEQIEQEKRSLLEDAYSYKKGKQTDLALSKFKLIVKRYPNEPIGLEAAYQVGLILEASGHSLQADHYFDLMPQGFEGQSNYYASVLSIRAERLIKKNKLKQAMALYEELMAKYVDYDYLSVVDLQWRRLAFQLFFSPRLGSFSTYYEVVPGDSLYVIAKKYKTTIDYIEKVNNLKQGSFIHPGDRLKVPRSDLIKEVDVDLTRRLLFLKFDGRVMKEYKIAIGEDNRTPIGEFRVQNKLKNPVWFHDGQKIPYGDSRNILGSRWIGFDKDIGIHGTVDPSDLWDQVSNGCIRMRNEDIEELYLVLTEGVPINLKE